MIQSQRSCVEIYDLASVSMIVRSVSDSVRQTASQVSTNVRRKRGLISRPAVHDCAPVQVAVEPKVRFRPPSWLCSTLGRESDPNQTAPQANAFVFGDEVARWFSLELQPRHHSL
jgi:hypothetical protein